MHIDPAMVMAILMIGGIGVIGIVQTIKTWLKLSGGLALALTLVVSFGATALVLSQAHVFTWLAFVLYGLIVFGEASGLYKVIKA